MCGVAKIAFEKYSKYFVLHSCTAIFGPYIQRCETTLYQWRGWARLGCRIYQSLIRSVPVALSPWV